MIRSATKSVRRATRALRAGLASFEQDQSPVAEAVRQEFIVASRTREDGDLQGRSRPARHTANSIAARSRRRAQAVLAMRANDEIGDDAFHQMEEELDWLEMAGGGS